MKRVARRAWPLLVVALTLLPALMVVLGGRDVDALEYTSSYDPDSFYSWVGRFATLLVLGLAGLTVAFGPQKRLPSESSRNRAFPLLVALVVFLLGNNLLPALFGAVPSFDTSALYAFVVLFAAYAARQLPIQSYLAALKASLLVLMMAGLVAIILAPTLAVQANVTDLRLPILEYRFWGLGSSPNNIAPLGLLLILLTIHTPFKSRVLTLLAYVSAMITIILAQSVTTWSAGLLVVPAFALYCRTPKPISKARISPVLAILALVGVTVGMSSLIWEAAHFDFSSLGDASVRIESGSIISYEKYDDSGMFSGRTDIWEIAMGVWRDHPVFGYGLTAWDADFRTMIGVPTAFHAHNQVMQSVSVGGWVGLVGLVAYVATLITLSYRTTRRSNGLTLALLVILMIRGFTEGPLETSTLLSGEVLYHATLVYLIAANLTKKRSKTVVRSRRRRRHSRRTVAETAALA